MKKLSEIWNTVTIVKRLRGHYTFISELSLIAEIKNGEMASHIFIAKT
ncbi:hypothetical protein NZD88_19730 [Chryseobacterium antibioticum]|uniref:Uncharacterized protein n=1 Tax=Chryseobacterium pyrolae TaxID=2987481 RepID=A0ABT2IMA7_9FLAO|nr:hypothetical protein [Chryseobacterium pyrolae]MCT2409789.1 hypothetical protein [Chryseobacterium pyrolae]